MNKEINKIEELCKLQGRQDVVMKYQNFLLKNSDAFDAKQFSLLASFSKELVEFVSTKNKDLTNEE